MEGGHPSNKVEEDERSVSFPRPRSLPYAFLVKTFDMVSNPETNHLIFWNNTDDGFVVNDYAKFSSDLLPRYFKHNNFSSFIRQLNFYGFTKIDSDAIEFVHEFFRKGQKHLLVNIRRKVSLQRRSTINRFATEMESRKDQECVLVRQVIEMMQQQQRLHMAKLHTVEERLHVVEERLHAVEMNHRELAVSVEGLFISKSAFIPQLSRRGGDACLEGPSKKPRLDKEKRLPTEIDSMASDLSKGGEECIIEDGDDSDEIAYAEMLVDFIGDGSKDS